MLFKQFILFGLRSGNSLAAFIFFVVIINNVRANLISYDNSDGGIGEVRQLNQNQQRRHTHKEFDFEQEKEDFNKRQFNHFNVGSKKYGVAENKTHIKRIKKNIIYHNVAVPGVVDEFTDVLPEFANKVNISYQRRNEFKALLRRSSKSINKQASTKIVARVKLRKKLLKNRHKKSLLLLHRRKRYLLFPEGSSFQMVFDLIIPIVDYTNFAIMGITCAVAWELPSKPPSEIIENFRDKLNDGTFGLSRRNDSTQAKIKYVDVHDDNDYDNQLTSATDFAKNTAKQFDYKYDNSDNRKSTIRPISQSNIIYSSAFYQPNSSIKTYTQSVHANPNSYFYHQSPSIASSVSNDTYSYPYYNNKIAKKYYEVKSRKKPIFKDIAQVRTGKMKFNNEKQNILKLKNFDNAQSRDMYSNKFEGLHLKLPYQKQSYTNKKYNPKNGAIDIYANNYLTNTYNSEKNKKHTPLNWQKYKNGELQWIKGTTIAEPLISGTYEYHSNDHISNNRKILNKPSKYMRYQVFGKKRRRRQIHCTDDFMRESEMKLQQIHIREHLTTREKLYSKIEKLYEARGHNGTACVLQALCESGVNQANQLNASKRHEQQTEPSSFITELLHAIFALPKDKILYLSNIGINKMIGGEKREYHIDPKKHIALHYLEAHAYAGNCAQRYADCKHRIWNKEIFDI